MTININLYRKYETDDGKRSHVGYDPQLIEDLVNEYNELEKRVAALESRPKPKKVSNIIRVKDTER